MEFKTAVFYFLSAILVFASLRVLTARNAVVAVLHLILAFFSAGGVWALLQAEFLAIGIILIYVGAVMVLFLFVVMMLDINIDRIREKFWGYLPLGAIVGLIMLAELGAVMKANYLTVLEADAPQVAANVSNTKELGRLIYTDYVYPFELASVVLLVAIVAAIAITYRGAKPSKSSKVADQIRVKAKDRVRVLQMPAEKQD